MVDSVTTFHKIGKITYIVIGGYSENATDTLHKRIEKLIWRDLQKSSENVDFVEKILDVEGKL